MAQHPEKPSDLDPDAQPATPGPSLVPELPSRSPQAPVRRLEIPQFAPRVAATHAPSWMTRVDEADAAEAPGEPEDVPSSEAHAEAGQPPAITQETQPPQPPAAETAPVLESWMPPRERPISEVVGVEVVRDAVPRTMSDPRLEAMRKASSARHPGYRLQSQQVRAEAEAKPVSSRATVAAWVGMILLLLSVVVPTLTRARTRAHAPDDASLQAAADKIGEDLQPGDALAFFPGWSAHQPWRFAATWKAKNIDFNGALLQGEVPGENVDLWQADGHTRLWVVTTHGYLDQLAVAAKERKRHDLGHGTAAVLFELPKSTTVFDFRKQLSQAKVTVATPQPPRDCTWVGPADSGKFACHGQEFQDVWQNIQEVGNTRRDCIYVHPPADNGTLRLQYPAQTATSPLQLSGYVGNRLWAVRHNTEGSPLRFRVVVGNAIKHEITLPTGDFTLHRFAVPLSAAEASQPIAFEAFAAKEAWREACFDARLVAAKP